MIRPFDPVAVERDMKAKKFKTRELENAVRQALDPSLLEEEEQEDEEEEEEDEEEEEEEVVTTKKTTRGRSKASSTAKNASAAKKKTAPKRSKSRSKDEEEEEVESSPAKAKRRSRKLEESDKDAIHETDTGRKKRVSWGWFLLCAAYTRVCGRDGRGSVCHAKSCLVDFFFLSLSFSANLSLHRIRKKVASALLHLNAIRVVSLKSQRMKHLNMIRSV